MNQNIFARVILNYILSITVTFGTVFLFFQKVEVLLTTKFTNTILRITDKISIFQFFNFLNKENFKS